MIFGKKEEPQEEIEVVQKVIRRREVKEKEPIKPWGKVERFVVLGVLLFTVLVAGILSLSARNWKLPGLPRFQFPKLSSFSFNPFKEGVIEVGSKGSKIDLEKIERVKKAFKDATQDYSGLYAFYIYDLKGDYFYGEGYQEKMQAASLIKLPVMTAIYKEAEEGKIDLSLYREYLEAMGKRSDNTSFNKMVTFLGKDKVEKSISDIGMSSTSYEENSTSPQDIGIFFKKLYTRELLNEEHSSEFISFLTDTIFESWLVPGIPDGITVAHKYGRETHVVNDAGIVYSNNPFILVIMSDGVIESEADDLFPKLSKLLYDGHVNEK